jgi:hypothetical protein
VDWIIKRKTPDSVADAEDFGYGTGHLWSCRMANNSSMPASIAGLEMRGARLAHQALSSEVDKLAHWHSCSIKAKALGI